MRICTKTILLIPYIRNGSCYILQRRLFLPSPFACEIVNSSSFLINLNHILLPKRLREREREREPREMGTEMEHGVVSNQSNGNNGCCKSGPGYASPLEAMSGPRETLIYVTAVYTGTYPSHGLSQRFYLSYLSI